MTQSAHSVQHPRVLLVDDERDLVETLKFRLEANAYEVITALDGATALKRAREEHPAFVILDLMLPKVNGFEVCQVLKQDPQYAHIPIVILTAKILDADEQRSRACGADAYIRKPFQTQELLNTMQSLLAATQEARRS